MPSWWAAALGALCESLVTKAASNVDKTSTVKESVATTSPPRSFNAIFPFRLPSAVSEVKLTDLLKAGVTLSRSRVESKCLAKSVVLGKPEMIEHHVVERSRLDGTASYSNLYQLAQQDGALSVDGETGALIARVSFAAPKQHYPNWNSNPWLCHVGERHRSSAALARVLGEGGLCIVVSESGESNTVKVFIKDEVYLFNVNPGEQTWLRLDPPQ